MQTHTLGGASGDSEKKAAAGPLTGRLVEAEAITTYRGTSLIRKRLPIEDPTVGPCTGPYGGPRGGAVSHERGTHVRIQASEGWQLATPWRSNLPTFVTISGRGPHNDRADPKVNHALSTFGSSGRKRLEKGHLLLPVRCQLAGLLVVAAQAVHARFNQDKAELGVAVLAVALQMLPHRHLILRYRVRNSLSEDTG